MTDTTDAQGEPLDDEALVDKSAPEDRAQAGPLDESEAPVRPYVDLGGLRIVPRPGMQMRLEVEERTKRIVAVTLEHEGSTVQLQPFAAPRSEGIWAPVRQVLRTQLERQGATVDEAEGLLGPELRARLQSGPDGAPRAVRIIGVDGPRWMLQGLIGGQAAVDDEQAAKAIELFRSTVVCRGAQPMPPRDLIPLSAPKPV
ncbi:DUF3710 domain-containing protein [Agrococcus sediminis]|jgi:hypothetical protein|uniref:DUF3710 domain-containing protein n=1 Tax=Agrococcus TaxID=46352 RepID=UPI000FE2DEF1|nr:DUF3710 domain-containing protein [Agrococcus sp. BE272]MDR7234550.1 hypothetical protein [Agrococcus sp. BE272]RWR21530.1 DUF3710 domain-containing protein [Agrococcus lahaulensis]